MASGSWVLAAIHKKIAGFQRDEVYIGTAEERAENDNKDDSQRLKKVGSPIPIPGMVNANLPKSLKKLMNIDPAVKEYIDSLRMTPKEAGDLVESAEKATDEKV